MQSKEIYEMVLRILVWAAFLSEERAFGLRKILGGDSRRAEYALLIPV